MVWPLKDYLEILFQMSNSLNRLSPLWHEELKRREKTGVTKIFHLNSLVVMELTLNTVRYVLLTNTDRTD